MADNEPTLTDYAAAMDAELDLTAAKAQGIRALAERNKALGNLWNMAGLAILSSPAAAVLIAWVVTR